MNLVTYKNQFPLGAGDLWDDFFKWSVPSASNNLSPRTNVSDDGSVYKLEMELPGMDKKDIDISLENNVLTIKAERKINSDKKNQNFYIHEMTHGTYRREFRLDDTVDTQNIKAKYENGILNLELLKSKKHPDKKISIQ